MFTEQVPKTDLSRDMSRKHDAAIYRTVYRGAHAGRNAPSPSMASCSSASMATTLPTTKSRSCSGGFEMFLKITDVFRETGRSVPVFNDKHLSWNWRQAKRMVEISRELKFPMLAGSSAPVAWRIPAVDAPFGAEQAHAVAISYSGLDIYGFHVPESLQSMTERRKGGETGVKSVQCLERDACWNFIEQNGWAKRLFEKALTHSKSRKSGDPKQLVKSPAVFVIDHNDGVRKRPPSCSPD